MLGKELGRHPPRRERRRLPHGLLRAGFLATAWLFAMRGSTGSRHNEPCDLRRRGRLATIAGRAWRCAMRCLECGAELAELARVCGRCGAWAPAGYQLYVTQDQAADAAGGPAPAAIHADAGQQHPESASDPDVDAAGPEPGTADPAAEAPQVRCLVCGAEIAGAAQVCARCRAPVARQVPVSADQAEDGPGEPIEPLPAESLHQAAGQPPGPGSRRNAWIMAGLGLVLLVSLTVLAASVTLIATRLASARPSAPPAPSFSPSLSSPATSEVVEDGLQAGDCLTGSGLGLGTTSPWPETFTVVPCTRPHVAEVFFAADAWPLSMESYPGDSKIDNEAAARCDAAFLAYDGTGYPDSALSYDYIDPDAYSWPPGDRRLVCIAYNSTSQYPGGAPVDYSIKGSDQ